MPGIDAYTFGPDKGSFVTVLWSYQGSSKSISVPAGTKVFDAQGNAVTVGKTVKVGYEPIYFVGGEVISN